MGQDAELDGFLELYETGECYHRSAKVSDGRAFGLSVKIEVVYLQGSRSQRAPSVLSMRFGQVIRRPRRNRLCLGPLYAPTSLTRGFSA